jgi:hypothetical protein
MLHFDYEDEERNKVSNEEEYVNKSVEINHEILLEDFVDERKVVHHQYRIKDILNDLKMLDEMILILKILK